MLLPAIVRELVDTAPTRAVRNVGQTLYAAVDAQLSVLREHGYPTMGDTDEHRP